MIYQELPQFISPYIIDLGFLRLHWYGAMYICAFVTVYLLTRYRIHKEALPISQQTNADVLLYMIIGLLVGGRLGYVLFYDLSYYLAQPLAIISPFHNGMLVGIAGMSFHGGLVGVVSALWYVCKKRNISFWQIVSLYIPAIPLGYMFGRIGNFINNELYGRETTSIFGMNFGDGILRHPSQLYEAFFEGIILFILLWTIRNKAWAKGWLLSFYLIGYGLARFCIEFVREPDPQLGFIFSFFTMGQVLSLAMILAGLLLLRFPKKI